ncbi:MAG: DUF1365 domain-containing protein [Geminicoccales bacterium]
MSGVATSSLLTGIVGEDACLYAGQVMHHRLQPKRHRFTYRTFTMLFDIDRLQDLDRRLRLFSFERFNLFSFRNIDHGPRDGQPLRPWVEAQLRQAGIERHPARIHLLAMPRFLGYVFNPLSLYYCYDEQERLFTIIYEVKNTFGGQHAYVLAVPDMQAINDDIRQQCDKNFYVSPFIEAGARYFFRMNTPEERLKVVIREEIKSGLLLIATLTGKRRALSDLELARQVWTHPFLTQKVIVSIHIQALKLWLKGIGLQPRNAEKPRATRSINEGTTGVKPAGEPPGLA